MAKIEIETRYTVDLSKLGPARRSQSISMGNSTFTMGLSEPNWTFRFNGHDYPEEIRDALIWCLDNLRNSEIKTENCTVFLTTTDEADITAFKLRWC